jgi:hypothetical protein
MFDRQGDETGENGKHRRQHDPRGAAFSALTKRPISPTTFPRGFPDKLAKACRHRHSGASEALDVPEETIEFFANRFSGGCKSSTNVVIALSNCSYMETRGRSVAIVRARSRLTMGNFDCSQNSCLVADGKSSLLVHKSVALTVNPAVIYRYDLLALLTDSSVKLAPPMSAVAHPFALCSPVSSSPASSKLFTILEAELSANPGPLETLNPAAEQSAGRV